LVEEDRVRVLVTGASGFVASHLVPALVDQGDEVFALSYDRDRIPSVGTPVYVDLATEFDSSDLPVVDAIVHLAQANVPFPDGAAALFAVNTGSTAKLLEHARSCGARSFVYASSASVYGLGNRPWSENDEPSARDFYSATKRASEIMLAAYEGELATYAMRLVAPYGPGQQNRMIPRLIASVREERPIVLNEGGRPRMNPVYIGDVVDLVKALLAGAAAGTYNVAGDEAVSIRQLGERIGRIVGAEPRFEDGTGSPGGDLVCENSRMTTLISNHLVSLDEGLERVAAA
jgi:nucleoside-diphosphate-sugar epimerase